MGSVMMFPLLLFLILGLSFIFFDQSSLGFPQLGGNFVPSVLGVWAFGSIWRHFQLSLLGASVAEGQGCCWAAPSCHAQGSLLQ